MYDNIVNGIPSDAIEDFIEEVITSDDVPALLPSNFKKEDAALLLLLWLVDHKNITSNTLQEMYKVPHAQWVRIVERLVPAMKAFVQANIQLTTLAARKQLAKENMPEPYKEYTGILDGVHIRIKGKRKHDTSVFPRGKFGSHKFGYKDAVSFQVVVNAAGECMLVDDGNPAGVHDYKCLWRANFDNHLKFPEDKLLADCGYIGNRIRLAITTPYKCPPGRELNATEQKINKSISSVRVRVEHFFGVAKGRFDFLREYRGALHLLPILIEECTKEDFDLPYMRDFESTKTIGGKRYLVDPEAEEEERWQMARQQQELLHPQYKAQLDQYLNNRQMLSTTG